MTDPISRRNFVKTAALSSLAASFAAQARWAQAKTAAVQDSHILFAGTQTGPSSKGIYAFHWDPSNGELKELGLAGESTNPTFIALSPDGRHLYAANELEEFQGAKSGAVSSFSIDRTAARLTLVNTVAATGRGTCQVTLDHTGRVLACANYSGSAASFHIDAAGRLSDAVSQFQYQGHGPVADRQESAHAHRATFSPDNRYVYINDLGLDCIHIYHLDAATAKLTPNSPPQWTAKPGSGPRALRFHPNGKWAYCVHELAPSIEVLGWNGGNGAFDSLQRVDLVPKDYRGSLATGSEIVFDAEGHFAYAAVRGYDRIVAFRIDAATGKLTQIGVTSCGGKVPRHITLDPTERWLLAANQISDNISVIRRDAQTGELAETGSSFPLVKPQCLVFV